MCGIVGYVVSGGAFSADSLVPMLDSIQHRGPDGAGTWIGGEDGVALGHRRLAIVDLSTAGHQPMISDCGRYVITFNGEIYNHLDLRARLERANCIPSGGWRGHSDTETLLAAIAAWGLNQALQASVGMFALALWDTQEKTLRLARDRLGEKPLFFGWQRDAFVFASEIKAVRRYPGFLSEINWDAANAFLRLNFVPGPTTIYRNLFKVPPACVITMDAACFQSKSLPEPEPYWSLASAALTGQRNSFKGSFEEAVDALDLLVGQSVEKQAIADVPLGAFLSGGIDSSLVVAKMQQCSRQPITTFSIGMPESGMDESEHAKAVSRHLGTDHVAHQISSKEALEIIPSLSSIWDEPFADSSQIPTLLVSRLARKRVTVALSGDGGDEFFLGYNLYPFYQKLWRTRYLGLLPWMSGFRLIPTHVRNATINRGMTRATSVIGAWRQADPQMLARYWFDRYRGGKVPLRNHEESDLIELPRLPGVAETAGLWDAGTYLPDDILTKVDRASMANSLETRAPLLDHRVVEFALTLPESFKLSGGIGKKVLREVLYRYVPRSIVDRPKTGFSIPLARWLREGLKDWAQDLLDTIPMDDEVFHKPSIDLLWSEHLKGTDHTERLWGILSLAGFVNAQRKRA